MMIKRKHEKCNYCSSQDYQNVTLLIIRRKKFGLDQI